MSAPIEQLLVDYCAAVDARTDPAGIAARFWTEGGLLDNTALGSPLVEGRTALAENFTGMFAAMEMLDHRISDFQVVEADDLAAQARAHVAAAGRPTGGAAFSIAGEYQLEARRTDAGWQLSRLAFTPLG